MNLVKHYIAGLFLLMACQFATMAQTDPGRTAKTIVADVLAQLPSQTPDKTAALMGELVKTGEEGVLQIVKMMSAPGKGDNTSMEYALNSMARYVLHNEETASMRTMLSNAFIKSLEVANDKEIKFFILTQLQLIAKEEATDAVAAYLLDERLSDVASRTMVRIGDEKAKQAVVNALTKSTTATTTMSLMKAVGDMKIIAAENIIMDIEKKSGNDRNVKQLALDVLARVASEKALPTLKEAAKTENFIYNDKLAATDSYLYFLNRMLDNGHKELVQKEANELLKICNAKNQIHAKNFATELLVKINGEKALPLIAKAMKSDSRVYRQGVLNTTATSLESPATTELLLKLLKKATPAAKVDIMDYFATTKNREAVSTIARYINDKDSVVSEKAIRTLAIIGGDNALESMLTILNGEDVVKIAQVQKALTYFNGDVATVLLKNIDSYSLVGKQTAVYILGYRASSAASDKVFSFLSSNNQQLQNAAFNALKGVSTEKDLNTLCQLMNTETDASKVADLQAAILAAVTPMEMKAKENFLLDQMKKVAADKKINYYYLLGAVGSVNKDILNLFFNSLNSNMEAEKKIAIQNLTIHQSHEEVIRRALQLSQEKSSLTTDLIPVILAQVKNADLTAERQFIFLREAFKLAKTDAEKKNILSAMSNAKTFQALMFVGNYIDVPALQQAAARSVMNIALSDKAFNGAQVKTYLNKVLEVLQGGDSQYEKEAVRKHLAEMEQGEGFVSIFNGKDLTGWKGLVANPIARAKMSASKLAEAQKKADEVMRAGWSVVDGEMVFSGKGDNICTEKQYGDFEMLVDWKLDPNGPEPDAGIYLRGTPQVQIWDISRTDIGAQVGSGGLYNNTKNERNPSHVADNPLGEWNTFRIIMKGDRVTVYLNGELVVNNVIMENYWDRSQPIPFLEQIELQAHGSKVYYRDIYVKELSRVEPFQLPADEKKAGFKVLFDGTGMHGWIGNTKDYVTEDGCIVLYPKNGGGGNLYTEGEYDDFILRFEFMLTPGANNGLGVRTPLEGDAAYVGMELQILDNEAPIYKDLQIYQYHGSVYGVIPAKRGYLKTTGEWNQQEVYFKGNKVKVTLNGTVILEGDIAEASKNFTETRDHREHPGLSNKKGHLGFLGHGSLVKFKNIRIKELK